MKELTEKHLILKTMIESNEFPTILNCSSGPDEYFTLGELQDLGWMRKRYIYDSEGEVDGWERDYFGPNSFKLITLGSDKPEIVKPNSTIY